ncbi:leucine-rich repeat-containing protein 51-like isoform X1, partial [Gryllus bimaculatus]
CIMTTNEYEEDETIKKPKYFCPEPETLIFCSPPVDHSFKKLSDLASYTGSSKKPRVCRLGRLPDRSSNNRFISRSLWLNNNRLKNLTDLYPFVEKFFDQPEALGWLDLSFNEFCDVSPEILKFPNLRILYLHGNKIKALTPLATLRDVPTLRYLTLRGNPVEKILAYRLLVIALLPQLISLDYALITDYERGTRIPECA